MEKIEELLLLDLLRLIILSILGVDVVITTANKRSSYKHRGAAHLFSKEMIVLLVKMLQRLRIKKNNLN